MFVRPVVVGGGGNIRRGNHESLPRRRRKAGSKCSSLQNRTVNHGEVLVLHSINVLYLVIRVGQQNDGPRSPSRALGAVVWYCLVEVLSGRTLSPPNSLLSRHRAQKIDHQTSLIFQRNSTTH